MIDALDRLRLLTVGAVLTLLVLTLAVVVFRGFDDAALTAAGPQDADAGEPGEGASPGPSEGEGAPEAERGRDAVVDAGDDLVLVSEEVAPVTPRSEGRSTTPTSSTSIAPTAAAAQTPTTPTTPPTSQPTSPPVTTPAPPRPTTPQTPTTPPAPAPKPAVVDVAVLSGGQLLAVDVNLGATNLVNLSLLQP